MKALSSCSSLSFLTLSLDGMGDIGKGGDNDLWLGLERLMAVLTHVVCLDISECLMKDRNLEVRKA